MNIALLTLPFCPSTAAMPTRIGRGTLSASSHFSPTALEDAAPFLPVVAGMTGSRELSATQPNTEAERPFARSISLGF